MIMSVSWNSFETNASGCSFPTITNFATGTEYQLFL
jgi:hypothetical protein